MYAETGLSQLHGTLLDLLSTHRSVDEDYLKALTTDDWDVMLRAVHQHRLGPLLYWRLTRERRELPVPASVRASLAQSFKYWTLRALITQRDLLLTHRILEKAGIPHIALKGSCLAFHVYPSPALRPMRDLDILVPREWALRAYRALIDGGLTRPEHYRGDPEAAMKAQKHLPPLLSPSGQVSIELHTRRFNPEHQADGLIDESDAPQLWQHAIRREIGGETLFYLSFTDLLLHLIVHAVYDHKLNNGPLVLSDLAYLLQMQTIDWPLFWRFAEERGQIAGCRLLLRLVERYFGPQPVQWPDAESKTPEPTEMMLEVASSLMLRDTEGESDKELELMVRQQSSIRGRLTVFFRKAFPARRDIAAQYPVPEDSLRVFLWYPVKWWRLIAVRLPAYLRRRRQSDIEQLNQLENWLHRTS